MASAFSMPTAAERGYNVFWREGVVNFCPGCGRSHWYLRTMSAECAFCGTALQYQNPVVSSTKIRRRHGGREWQ